MKPSHIILAFATSAVAAVLPRATDHGGLLPHDVVHKFPAGTWIENLAIRSNGAILATDDTNARLYQVDPSGKQPVITVHDFRKVDGIAFITGIVETDPDVFLVASSNYSSAELEGYGQHYVFRVDLRSEDPTNAKVTRIAEVSNAGILNGLAYLSESRTLLISDSFAGVVWGVDIDTAVIDVAINNTYTRYADGFGVNGIKVSEDRLYFTATSKEAYASVAIDSNGHANGDVQVLAQGDFRPDDFALDSCGDAYITNFAKGDNGVVFVPAEGGRPKKMAKMAGPTSASFGRTREDCHILYVGVTGGDYKTDADGTFIGQGGIVSVDLGDKVRERCRQFLF